MSAEHQKTVSAEYKFKETWQMSRSFQLRLKCCDFDDIAEILNRPSGFAIFGSVLLGTHLKRKIRPYTGLIPADAGGEVVGRALK
jgi:hypothetical protein